MLENSWKRKEKPFAGFGGFGGGAGGLGFKSAAAGPNLSSSGGIISEYEDYDGDGEPTGNLYRAHVFTGPGTYTVNTVPTSGNVAVFLVGGGGAGSAGFASYGPGAGGGAGGWVLTTGMPVSAGTDYAITVGRGGGGGVSLSPNGSQYSAGEDGYPSTFVWSPTTTITALGGGGGGCGPTNNWSQNTVASGGGGGYGPGPTNGPQPGSQPTQNPGIPWYLVQYGSQGGDGDSSNVAGAGAGGGSHSGGQGYQGSSSTVSAGGNGGPLNYVNGKDWVAYCKGGNANGPSGVGAYPEMQVTGNGGDGSRKNASGYSAYMGGDGGPGIVVVRYSISELSGTSKATGGMISYYNDMVIHTFISPGTFNNTSPSPLSIEYVVVGGGGGGGSSDNGAGGGAGAFVTGTMTAPTGSASIDVEQGGQWHMGPGNNRSGLNGGQSQINYAPTNQTTAVGGGYGGGDYHGAGGGSGGGGASDGSWNGGSASNPSYGYPGGPGQWPPAGPAYGAGGGGGAGGAGVAGSGAIGGHGGIGVQLPATFQDPDSSVGTLGPGDTKYWFCGGGAGGNDGSPTAPHISTRGWGGAGPTGSPTDVPFAGGGNGGYYPNPGSQGHGTEGLVGTGGGGGGTGNKSRNGGAGGSGIVIIAYPA